MAVPPQTPERSLARALRLLEEGRTPRAVKVCQTILQDDPRHAEALHTMGALAAHEGQWPAALRWFRKAVSNGAVEPRYRTSQAIALWSLGRTDDAIAVAEDGLEVFPDDPDLLCHYAKFLADASRHSRALPALEEALLVAPDRGPLLARAARICELQGLLGKSARFWSEYLKLAPRDGAAINNLAGVRGAQGRIAEALELYREAARIRAVSIPARSNRLLMLHYSNQPPASLFAEHRAWGQTVGGPSRSFPRAPSIRRKKLRVGYVSGDFRLHAVAYFIEPILRSHDPDQVEVHCFSNSPLEDAVTTRLRRFTAGWSGIAGMSDERAAESIRRAKIDILVDLSGHTALGRLPLFALKPAPIQVNYLGYPDTTGLRAVDYRFTDSIADPPGTTEHVHTETLIRLDPCFLCYRPLLERLPVGPPPSTSNGYVTLACFAIRQKLSQATLEAWGEILRLVPRSRLLLKCRSLADPDVARGIREFFRSRGISSRRLQLEAQTPGMREHLISYRRADLMLDPYPYNGTTMTCEALWMGIPAITWSGQTHAARVGATILNAVGLPQLIADSADSYVGKAVKTAADPARLAALRRELRSRMRASPIRDAIGLTRRIEQSYRQMWLA